jgi:hypothetical protein
MHLMTFVIFLTWDIPILTDVYKLAQSCKLAATTYLPKLVALSITGRKGLTLYPPRRS